MQRDCPVAQMLLEEGDSVIDRPSDSQIPTVRLRCALDFDARVLWLPTSVRSMTGSGCSNGYCSRGQS